MASRLDRLFQLIDTGSTPAIRKAAALQIGEIQKQHPHDLHTLLYRTHVLLRSKSWETRIAAGQTFATICANVLDWEPADEGVLYCILSNNNYNLK